MCMTQHIAARAMVWLAAIVLPLQGVPTAACSCMTSATSANNREQPPSCGGVSSASVSDTSPAPCCSQKSVSRCRCAGATTCCCGEVSSSQQPSRSCCSGSTRSQSCCSSDDGSSGCSCGDNCQCGQNDSPPQPTVPPLENNSPERIVADSAAAASCEAAAHPSPTLRRHSDRCAGANPPSALDRCVSLCRFTI